MRRALPVLFFVFFSCGNVGFEVEQDLGKQTIQGNPLGGVLPMGLLPNPYALNINIEAEVAKRGTGPAQKAFLKSLSLAISTADTPSADFDFLDETHLYVEGPGLSKVEIAKLKPVPNGVKSLSFEIVPMVDLLPYIKAGATISANATGTQPTVDTTFSGVVVIEVKI